MHVPEELVKRECGEDEERRVVELAVDGGSEQAFGSANAGCRRKRVPFDQSIPGT